MQSLQSFTWWLWNIFLEIRMIMFSIIFIRRIWIFSNLLAIFFSHPTAPTACKWFPNIWQKPILQFPFHKSSDRSKSNDGFSSIFESFSYFFTSTEAKRRKTQQSEKLFRICLFIRRTNSSMAALRKCAQTQQRMISMHARVGWIIHSLEIKANMWTIHHSNENACTTLSPVIDAQKLDFWIIFFGHVCRSWKARKTVEAE